MRLGDRAGWPGAPSPPPSEGTPGRARDTPARGTGRAPSRPRVGTGGALGGGPWLPPWGGPGGAPRATPGHPPDGGPARGGSGADCRGRLCDITKLTIKCFQGSIECRDGQLPLRRHHCVHRRHRSTASAVNVQGLWKLQGGSGARGRAWLITATRPAGQRPTSGSISVLP